MWSICPDAFRFSKIAGHSGRTVVIPDRKHSSKELSPVADPGLEVWIGGSVLISVVFPCRIGPLGVAIHVIVWVDGQFVHISEPGRECYRLVSLCADGWR